MPTLESSRLFTPERPRDDDALRIDVDPAELLPAPAGADQARLLLRAGFVAAPILAGADKFFDAMTDWEDFLAPQIARALPMKKRTFMRLVGIVEIGAGLLVLAKPKLGGYVVGGWLAGIIGNLALRGRAWDVALRDLGLAIGAVALARLETRR